MPFNRLINRIIGNLIEHFPDENDIKLIRFAISIQFVTVIGSLIWTILCLSLGRYDIFYIPFGYICASLINLSFLFILKNFQIFVWIQTLCVLILPFIFQWLFGGFYASGGVMIWSILSLVTSTVYSNKKLSIFSLSLFTVLVCVSIFFDPYFKSMFNGQTQENFILVFLIMNFLFVAITLYGLFDFYIKKQIALANTAKVAHDMLIQSEKLASIGEISAAIAHELNSPLGVIKAYTSDNISNDSNLINLLHEIQHTLNSEESTILRKIISEHRLTHHYISSLEERELVLNLKLELENQGIDKATKIATQLVQIEMFKFSPELQAFQRENLEKIVAVLHLIFIKQKHNRAVVLAVEKTTKIIKALKMYLQNSGSTNPEAFNLSESIQTILVIYDNHLKNRIKTTVDIPPLLSVIGHEDQINQIWTNLIMNSCQAMNFDGELKIKAWEEENSIIVSISDNGVGIPQEIGNKIFEPFYSTKNKGEGAGIGLDIVNKIIQNHRGKIWFESIEGRGTTFFVKLPRDFRTV
jgi:signal transduction histidine kinase